MFKRNIKSSFYKKIFVQSPTNYIKINCKSKFEFKYDVKDVNIFSLMDKHDIENDFINVISMECKDHGKKFIHLKQSDKSSYYTMKSDFSNILEISDKFNVLVESLLKSFELQLLSVNIKEGLNYIIRSKDGSKNYISSYVDNNFKDFDVPEKYDLEVVSGTYPKFNNKIVFDGKFLKTRNYIVKFMKKPDIDKFEIEIDRKIDDVQLIYSYDMNGKIFMSNYKYQNGKYDIFFNPKKLDHFLYLKILNDSSWCKNGSNVYYSEDEVLSGLYNI